MERKDLVIVLGINDYKGKLDNLESPAPDACYFIQCLKEHKGNILEGSKIYCYAYEGDTKKMVCQNDECTCNNKVLPKREDIIKLIYEVVKESKDKPIRRLYLYFSGHGWELPQDPAIIFPEILGTRHATLGGRSLATYLEEYSKCQEIVLIMDCCRKDVNLKDAWHFGSNDWSLEEDEREFHTQSSYHLFAAKPGVIAEEKWNHQLGRKSSLFSTALFKAFKSMFKN